MTYVRLFVVIGALALVAAPASGRGAVTRGFDASMPRARQIQIAMTAAPSAVSRNATIYVLGKHGFEKARTGTNGATCLIDRTFRGSVPMSIEPKCFDVEGTRVFLPVSLRTEALRARGVSEAAIAADIERGYKDGRFHAPAKPGLIYMLSPVNVIPMDPQNTVFKHVAGHLMFYAPYLTPKDLGYGSGSPKMVPFLTNAGAPYALMIVVPK